MHSSFVFFLFHLLYLTAFVVNGQAPKVESMPGAEKCVVKCVYKITFRPDSTSIETRVEYSTLVMGNSLSKFETVGNYVSDSIRGTYPKVLTPSNTNPQEYADKMLSAPYTRFHFLIYKKASAGRLYCYDKVGNALYRYVEHDRLFTWKIGPEKASISGYSCQRATTNFAGRAYEAWFTREVPISEGPYKFYGLPGLIVKINDLANYYSFELTKLSKTPPSVSVALPASGATLTTKEALRKGQAVYHASLANRAPPAGNGLSAAQLQRMRKPTTPLELR